MKPRNASPHDEGFSLIELLVAIAILGVISIPMLQGFIVTHRTTMKALELQGATLAAQNIMEDLHALTLEEIFASYGAGEEADGKTKITVTGLEASGVSYDAVISLETNEKEALELSSPVTFDAAQDLRVTVPDVSGASRRVITVSVAATKEAVEVSVTSTVDGKQVFEEVNAYEGTPLLRNLFLCYTPNYASTQRTYDREDFSYLDTVRLDNPSGYPVRIVLIKTAAGNVADKERAYRVRLEGRTLQGETMAVYTNLNTNIGSGRGERMEKLPHQTYVSDNIRLLPLEGVSGGSGAFYRAEVKIYSAGALEEKEAARPLVTLTDTESDA